MINILRFRVVISIISSLMFLSLSTNLRHSGISSSLWDVSSARTQQYIKYLKTMKHCIQCGSAGSVQDIMLHFLKKNFPTSQSPHIYWCKSFHKCIISHLISLWRCVSGFHTVCSSAHTALFHLVGLADWELVVGVLEAAGGLVGLADASYNFLPCGSNRSPFSFGWWSKLSDPMYWDIMEGAPSKNHGLHDISK